MLEVTGRVQRPLAGSGLSEEQEEMGGGSPVTLWMSFSLPWWKQWESSCIRYL